MHQLLDAEEKEKPGNPQTNQQFQVRPCDPPSHRIPESRQRLHGLQRINCAAAPANQLLAEISVIESSLNPMTSRPAMAAINDSHCVLVRAGRERPGQTNETSVIHRELPAIRRISHEDLQKRAQDHPVGRKPE
jgi:hypothetical protein